MKTNKRQEEVTKDLTNANKGPDKVAHNFNATNKQNTGRSDKTLK